MEFGGHDNSTTANNNRTTAVRLRLPERHKGGYQRQSYGSDLEVTEAR